MSLESPFQRTWRVTWWRAAVMGGVVAFPMVPMIAPMAGSFTLEGLGAALAGFGAVLLIPALWLLTFGVRLDHRLADRGLWRSIVAHTLGMTGTVLVVLVVLAFGPAPEAIWFVFMMPGVLVLAAIAALVASAVPGSFPERAAVTPAKVDVPKVPESSADEASS